MATRTDRDLDAWLRSRSGIAHRDELLRNGFSERMLRDVVRRGRARRIRRVWLVLPDADRDLVAAAQAGGAVSCVTLARRRGWWMPEGIGAEPHIHLRPHAGPACMPEGWDGIVHWTKPLAGAGPALEATVPDALAHIAVCQPRDTALVLWESAAKVEKIAPETLRGIGWNSSAAHELAASVVGLSDSGLETLLVLPLRRWGLRVRQQVVLAGRPVDLLVGERLVIQVDGYEFHSSAKQRASDVAHDAELRLRGYTVIRLSYHQIVRAWPATERMLRTTVARGLHLAA
ncbi:MAG: DUF559 domain-containing protein [Microbacterium sp.]